MAVVVAYPTLDYRTLIEHIPVVTYTVDFSDPKTVTYVSPQVTSLMGFTPEEYRANDRIWPDRIDTRDRAIVLDALQRIQKTGEPFVCDYRFRHRDGRVLWIHDDATVIRDASGRPRAMQGIMQDVTARRKVEQQLADAQRLVREEARTHLLARAISAQEEERTRVARELHDETGQSLSAILVGLRNVQEAETLDEVRVLVQQLRDLTSQTVRDVGRIARGLRPSTLDDLGLVPALQHYADELGAARGIEIAIKDDGLGRLPRDIETTLYRIIQEALTNVARHAEAHHANVTIERDQENVRAAIRDDGMGFNVTEARTALGLVGMQERASLLGGSVEIDSHLRSGSIVKVELPLHNGGH